MNNPKINQLNAGIFDPKLTPLVEAVNEIHNDLYVRLYNLSTALDSIEVRLQTLQTLVESHHP